MYLLARSVFFEPEPANSVDLRGPDIVPLESNLGVRVGDRTTLENSLKDISDNGGRIITTD